MEKRAMAVREEQWIQTIAAAKQSGQPIKVWCAEHGVPVSSFYKWQRKMRDSLLTAQNSEIQFQELEVPQNICGTACKNRHPSPICTQFEHHFHVVKPHLHTLKSQKPYNWSSTAEL